MKRIFVAATLAVFSHFLAAAQGGLGPTVSPASESSAAATPASSTAQTPRALLQLTVVESEQDIQDRRLREVRAEKHDADDLDAQVRTANAAERQVVVSWSALAISCLGTIAVLLALRESRRGVELSLEASRAYQRAERAWVAISSVNHDQADGLDQDGPVSGLVFTARWLNAGHTPALKCSTQTQLKIIGLTHDFHPPTFITDPDTLARTTTMVPGVAASSPGQLLRLDDVERLKRREHRVYLHARVTYRDVFLSTEVRHSEHCMEIEYAGFATDTRTGHGSDRFSFSAVGPQNTAS